jgi:hypothetical protein
LEPNFDKIVIGRSSSKIVSESLTWIKAAFNYNATALWWPSWRESATAGHHFGRGPSNLNCSYMARSSLAYVQGFFLKFFFQPIYTDYAN